MHNNFSLIYTKRNDISSHKNTLQNKILRIFYCKHLLDVITDKVVIYIGKCSFSKSRKKFSWKNGNNKKHNNFKIPKADDSRTLTLIVASTQN